MKRLFHWAADGGPSRPVYEKPVSRPRSCRPTRHGGGLGLIAGSHLPAAVTTSTVIIFESVVTHHFSEPAKLALGLAGSPRYPIPFAPCRSAGLLEALSGFRGAPGADLMAAAIEELDSGGRREVQPVVAERNVCRDLV